MATVVEVEDCIPLDPPRCFREWSAGTISSPGQRYYWQSSPSYSHGKHQTRISFPQQHLWRWCAGWLLGLPPVVDMVLFNGPLQGRYDGLGSHAYTLGHDPSSVEAQVSYTFHWAAVEGHWRCNLKRPGQSINYYMQKAIVGLVGVTMEAAPTMLGNTTMI